VRGDRTRNPWVGSRVFYHWAKSPRWGINSRLDQFAYFISTCGRSGFYGTNKIALVLNNAVFSTFSMPILYSYKMLKRQSWNYNIFWYGQCIYLNVSTKMYFTLYMLSLNGANNSTGELIVPQLSIRINYNGTWSILIQWLIGLW